jgi:hypothetical protein
MKKLSILSLSLVLVSCSHFQETPKTVEFPYAQELLEKVQAQTNREPASLTVDDVSTVSPRRVYFSALYHQYLTLGTHLGKKSNINFCPQFHHDKIQTDSSLVPRVSLYSSSNVDQEGRDFFPELAFEKRFSLRDYHAVIRSELETLCEEGVSDNFYKFDNLVTHYAARSSFHKDPKAMASVLKIPVFANFYLVKMLEIPGLNFTSPEEKRFIQLTRTQWFENYVTEASRMRNHFIKNKMVQR